MKKIVLLVVAFILMSCGNKSGEWITTVKPIDGECWWGAVVNKGYIQPYTDFSASDNYYLILQLMTGRFHESVFRNVSVRPGL